MSESDLPAYVASRYDPSCPTPGVLQSAQLYAAYTMGSTSACQELVDTFLNGPCAGALRFTALGIPLTDTIVLPLVLDQAFLTSKGMLSSGYPPQPDPAALGWARYSETAFVIPVWVESGTSSLPEGVPALQFFMPYIWVTAAPGMATGREAWGYRKTMSSIAFPHPAQDGVMNFEVRTLSQLSSAPESQTVAPLLRGHFPTPVMFFDDDSVWQDLAKKMLDELAQALVGPDKQDTLIPIPGGDPDQLIDIRSFLTTDTDPFTVWAINLKQFRDTADSSKACYQAIVASPIAVDNMQALGVIQPSKIKMAINQDSDTYDIAGDLGLKSPDDLKFFSAAYAQLDMAANPGTVLWQAGAAASISAAPPVPGAPPSPGS